MQIDCSLGLEKVIAALWRINVLISHPLFTAKLMKYYWVFTSTKRFSLYSTKFRAPKAKKKGCLAVCCPATACLLPSYSLLRHWSLVFTLCYENSVRWLQNQTPPLSPAFACRELFYAMLVMREFLPVPSSSGFEIFTHTACYHRKVQLLQPFIWVFPDLPFKFYSHRKARFLLFVQDDKEMHVYN